MKKKNIFLLLVTWCLCVFAQAQTPSAYELSSPNGQLALTIYGAQNETYIEGWEKKTSNLLIYKRLCNV